MIETEDLILDKGVFEDWKAMYRNIWSDGWVNRYMFWDLSENEEQAKQRMQRTIVYQSEHPYAYLVYLKETHEAIGFANMRISGDRQMSEGGIALAKCQSGKGYGKQVLNALVNYAFNELGFESFVYQCRAENTVSQRLAQSCGFHFEKEGEITDSRNGEKAMLYKYRKTKE